MNTKNMNQISSQAWVSDILSSFVVFLVALPLCMGIALASGLQPAQGIITGIIGGLVVGALSGSPLQVSGPAAGLTVIVWEIIQRNGVQNLGIIVACAGILQVLAGSLKVGQWFRAVSPAVIHGMLAGIGVLIFASQSHVLLDGEPQGSGINNLIMLPARIWNGITELGSSTQHAGIIGLITLLTIVLWNRFKPSALKLVPAPLLGIVVGTGLTHVLGFEIHFVPMPDRLFEGLAILTPSTLIQTWDLQFIVPIITIGLVASAETLLSASAVDQLHTGPRTQYNKELVAQGTGNLICGILNCLPMTGVIVRSSANIEAGAKTRRSAIFHGLWLLLFALVFPFVLKWIPTSALAGILVFTGYKLVNPKAIRELRLHGKAEVGIYLITLLTIVGKDLLTGVLVGLGLAFLNVLRRLARFRVELQVNEASGKKTLVLEGAAVFFHIPKIAAVLDSLPKDTVLEVQLEKLSFIDHGCLTLLGTWQKTHGRLVFENGSHPIKLALEKTGSGH